MKAAHSYLLVFCLLCGCSSFQPRNDSSYFGLSQTQLAAKVGFPLRSHLLSSKAIGGAGILFWVYYQRSPSGAIEEKRFTFGFTPHGLVVQGITPDTIPDRFLSLENKKDFQDIYQYNSEQGL